MNQNDARHRSTKADRRRKRARRLRCEGLEDRRLLAVLMTESFETSNPAGDSGLLNQGATFYDSSQDYWIRTNGLAPNFISLQGGSYSNTDGSFFFAGEDLDDDGGDGVDEKVLAINGIDISGHNNLSFSGLFAGNNVGTLRYDSTDYLIVEYQIDGGGFVEALRFRAEQPGGDTTNNALRVDTDNDGVGDGAQITTTFTNYGFNIPGIGSTLDIRIEAHMDAQDEEVAIDFLRVQGDLVVTNQPPTVSNVVANSVGEPEVGNTSYSFTVTYTDNSAIDVSTIGTGDVTVDGPGGPLIVTGAAVDINSDGVPRTVTYTVTPPGGSWNDADDGTYNISIAPSEVGDDGAPQLFVGAGLIGTFEVEATNTAPIVSNFLAEDVILSDFGETSYSFTIEYSDVGGIDASTIDANDVTVTSPSGVPAVTSLAGTTIDPDGTTVTATYSFTPPGGAWDPADDGVYTIDIVGGQVSDTTPAPNTLSVAAGNVTTFEVFDNKLFNESFETDGLGSRYTSTPPSFYAGLNDHFTRVEDLGSGLTSPQIGSASTPGEDLSAITGIDRNHFWSAEDVDHLNGADDEFVLEWTGIDITGANNLEFSGLFAADDDYSLGPRYDSDDYVHVFYRIDGAATFTKFLAFESDHNAPGTNSTLHQDTNLDGIGDGTQLTPAMNSFSANIPDGFVLDLRVAVRMDAAQEEVAFDSLMITGDPVLTNQAPIVATFSANDVGEPEVGASTHSFSVTYSDDSAVDVSTIDTGDVTLNGPGGPVPITGVSIDPPSDGTPRVATYTFTPPGGSWDSADNGIYNIAMGSMQVGDDDGTQLFVAPGAIGSFNVAADNSAPTVSDFLAEDIIVTDFGETSYSFTIQYSDVGGVDASSIDSNDVTVTAPGGVPTVTNLMGATVDPDGTTVHATYSFTPPGGTWDASDVGLYTIAMVGNEVGDTTPNPNDLFVAAGTVTTFEVFDNKLFNESFETDGLGSRYTSTPAPFHASSGDYFTRVRDLGGGVTSPQIASASSPSESSNAYTGQDRNHFWAAEDVDALNGADDEFVLEFSGINISGFTNLQFSGLFGADDANSIGTRYDSDDYLIVEYQIDGGGYSKLLAFESPDDPGTNSDLLLDSDLDGVGDSTQLTPALGVFDANLPDGATLDLRIRVHMDASQEEVAFDSLMVTGDSTTTNVNLSVSTNAGTEAGMTAITVSANTDAAVNGNQTVDLDVTGLGITTGDYTLSSSTIMIPDGSSTGSVTFTVVVDLLVEVGEQATLTMVNPSGGLLIGGTNSQDISITDNDTATFTINDVSANEDAGTLDFTLNLDNPVSFDLAVDVHFQDVSATGGGVDYNSTQQSFNFPMIGTGSQTVSVPIINDGFSEPNEEFTALLSVPTAIGNADIVFLDTGTGTILNDDGPAALTVTIAAASISEGAGPAATTATVTRNTDPTSALSVTLASDDTSEATVQANINIPAGQSTSPAFDINAINDVIVDGTQTVTITASAADHADGIDTVDVTDDEPIPVSTGIEVQNGEAQRSFVDSVDIAFTGNAGLQTLIDQGNIRVERFGIGPGPVTPGTGTNVPISNATVNGNLVELEFTGGIGGTNSAGDGFYRILLDTNNDGNFNDALYEFFRLYGDADGNGVVSLNDARTRVDMNGDGRFNVLDRVAARNNLGAAVDLALLGMIDD